MSLLLVPLTAGSLVAAVFGLQAGVATASIASPPSLPAGTTTATSDTTTPATTPATVTTPSTTAPPSDGQPSTVPTTTAPTPPTTFPVPVGSPIASGGPLPGTPPTTAPPVTVGPPVTHAPPQPSPAPRPPAPSRAAPVQSIASPPPAGTTSAQTGTGNSSATALDQPGSLITGYTLPIPAALASANPTWLGIDSPAPAAAAPDALVPATSAVLPLPAGTEVDAVTAGSIAAGPSGTVTLVGKDGATYTYTDVVGSPGSPGVGPASAVVAGQQIGSAGVGGITLAIAIPDVSGPVCATSALQAWSEGTNIDVRSLPQTCLTAPTTAAPTPAPAAQSPAPSVLIVTDALAGATGTDLQGLFSGSQVTASTVVVDESQSVQAQLAQITAAEPTPANLLVVSLAGGFPGGASTLLGLLPASQHVLWVPPPAQPPNPQTAIYQAAVAAHPNIRVETLPSALAVIATAPAGSPSPPGWSPVLAKATAAMEIRYAGSAYRLPLVNAQATAVLSFAEAQLGKPYVWAGAGPANFDCSGLTMMAYRQIGMNFVHNAYAQYEATKQNAVATADLQPGDLVFFGPNETGIHHVGIYIGNNQFIDAPQTGDLVRIDTLGPGWDYFGATRPYASPAASGPAGASLASSAGLDDNQAFAQALSDATWDPSQFASLLQLWDRESGWDPTATNPTSGAFGIPQALPADKMAAAGSDWLSDPYTQILWGIDYIQARYGTPAAAWAHETAFGWY